MTTPADPPLPSAAWAGRENARTDAERMRQSVECAKNPVAIWKDDRCQRIEER